MKKNFSLLFEILFFTPLFAQTETVEMADMMRTSGKIYVVVSVLVVVFIGIIFHLISIDRKLRKLEDKMKQEIKN